MNLRQNIEATIADFNLNDMPASRTAKRIMQLIKDDLSPKKDAAKESNCTSGLLAIGISKNDIGKIERFAERQDCSVKNLIMRALRLHQTQEEGVPKFETMGCMGE